MYKFKTLLGLAKDSDLGSSTNFVFMVQITRDVMGQTWLKQTVTGNKK